MIPEVVPQQAFCKL